MSDNSLVTLEEAVEWRVPLWAPAVESVCEKAAQRLPKGSRILEIGYNSGKMSCYLASKYGWEIIGYELSSEQKDKATELSKKLNLTQQLDFRVCSPDQTFNIPGEYDGIFLKSVLYHNKSMEDYIVWLKWLKSKLRPGGVLMAIENGQGTLIDKLYRKYNPNISWGENQFFNPTLEKQLKTIFSDVQLNYFGGISQYFSSYPALFSLAQRTEKHLGLRNSAHAFIASWVATA